MQSCRWTAGYVVLTLLLLWQPRRAAQAQAVPEQPLGPTFAPGPGRLPPPREEKSATDLVAKILLLNELVSLENDVFETKKKRSFSGFGSPLDRLSVGLKAKQRKAVELPKKRFGIPLDRIGVNRLSGSRG